MYAKWQSLCNDRAIQARCGKQRLAATGYINHEWLTAFISGLILRQKCDFWAQSAEKWGAKKSVKYVLAS